MQENPFFKHNTIEGNGRNKAPCCLAAIKTTELNYERCLGPESISAFPIAEGSAKTLLGINPGDVLDNLRYVADLIIIRWSIISDVCFFGTMEEPESHGGRRVAKWIH